MIVPSGESFFLNPHVQAAYQTNFIRNSRDGILQEQQYF